MNLQEHPDAWRYIIGRVAEDGMAAFVPNVVYFSPESNLLRRMVKQGDGSWVLVEETTMGCFVAESFG